MLKLFNIQRSAFSKKPFYISNCSYSSKQNKRVAVVLSGSGMLDGSEIHEAAAAVVHLSRFGLEPVFYGIPCLQADVIDHMTSKPMNEIRSAIAEGARIARGEICPITKLFVCDASAVVFPGGFGAAKTMSTYATQGCRLEVNGEVARVIEDFHCAKKPMGFMCISAILPAKLIPHVKITLGMNGDLKKWPHREAIKDATSMGAEVEPRGVEGFSFDKQHFVFSTPAYMYNGKFHQIFDGIGNMIDAMFRVME